MLISAQWLFHFHDCMCRGVDVLFLCRTLLGNVEKEEKPNKGENAPTFTKWKSRHI